MPNPWIILGSLIAAVALAAGAFFYGEHVENLSWKAAVEQQHAEAANQLAAETAKTAAIEKRLADINTQVEAEHADHQAALDAAFAENQRLAGQLNSLLQPGSGAGGSGAVSGASHTAASGQRLPPSYRELSSLVADLLNRGTRLALDADREAAAASECHDWAVSVAKTGAAP